MIYIYKNKKSTNKSKNNSYSNKRKVPVGRTVMVRNGHIYKYAKDPNGRRTHVVIETNNEDLALVRLTTKKKNTSQLKYYKDGSTYFKHFVETEDVNNNPLRVGNNITQNHKNMDLKDSDVKHIINVLSNSKKFNYKIFLFKNRYKKS